MLTSLFAEISPGELIDKITILEIKLERLVDADKIANVRTEVATLATTRDAAVPASPELDSLTAELKEINGRLWEIEDDICDCERNKDFGNAFVELAQGVYMTNDRRSRVKRRINELLGSRLVEEKSYAAY